MSLGGLLWLILKAERELLRTLYPSSWIVHCFKKRITKESVDLRTTKSGENTCPIINFLPSSPANIDKKHSVFSSH